MFLYLVSIAYDYSTLKQSWLHVRPTEYFTSATAAYTFAVLSPWQAIVLRLLPARIIVIVL